MGLVNMIRNGMRSFLQLKEAQPNQIIINEAMTFEDNAAKNQIWYRGESFELAQLFSQLQNTKNSFWGANSSQGQEIRKIHTGIPGLIVDRLVDIVVYDMNDFEFKDTKQSELWDSIQDENDFEQQLKDAIKDALVIGDGAFRISFDSEVSKLPIIEWVGGGRIQIKNKRGRLNEVIFTTRFEENRRTYTLKNITDLDT